MKIGFKESLVFIFTLLITISGYSQTIIWSEDFSSYPNGTNNLFGNDPAVTKWATQAYDADDGGIYNDSRNYWGVYDGEFRVNDIEGHLACTSNGYGGNNDNYWYTEVIDVSGYSQFSVSMKGRSEGDMECASVVYGCNAADLLEGCYQIDGEDWIPFFSMCGSRNGDINTGCVQVGNAHTLRLRIQVGNQAQSETYYFDDIKVVAVPVITGSNSLITGNTINLGENTSGGTWRSSNTAIATVDAVGKVTGVAPGNVTIYYTNTSGCEMHIDITVSTPCVTPVIQSTTPASRCDAGTVTLAATASAGTLNWYAQALGGTALGSGNSFITPGLSATTSYYVEAVSGTCISSRTEVKATVNTTPVFLNKTENSRCDDGTVVLGANFSGGTVGWYSQATGGVSLGNGDSFTTPTLTTTTSYYVEAVNGTCISSRTEVKATINHTPALITKTDNTRCGNGTVVLGANFSGGTVAWYSQAAGGVSLGNGNSFTTPTLSTTTSYYAEAVSGLCVSSRTEVIATVAPTPVLLTKTDNSRCGSGSVQLSATFSVGTLSWYAQVSGGLPVGNGDNFTTPLLTNSTSYFVEANNASCVSARTEVRATITKIPLLQTITPKSRCGSGSVMLKAVFSEGIISWYQQSSGGSPVAAGGNFTTPVISASTSYFVEAANVSCVSARTEVVATVNPVPVFSRLDIVDLNTAELSVLGGTAPYKYSVRNQLVPFIGNEVTIPRLPNGTYLLTVTDDNSCKCDSLITIYRPEILLKPEMAFSPNGDNINDNWDIENIESYPLTEVTLYDRYGKQLKTYEGNAFIPWDGTINGKKMPAQDYWYLIQVRETGERMIGHFVLRR